MIGIYKIENKVNGKVYIGQSVDIDRRQREHMRALNKSVHTNSYLQNAWNKYGAEQFAFEVLEECDLNSLDDREMYWINTYDSFNRNMGYNRTLGGDGNRLFSADTVYDACMLYKNNELTPDEIGKILNLDSKAVRRRLHFGTDIGLCNYEPNKTSWVKVVCLNTLHIYDSVDIAEQENHVNGITGCCKGKTKYAGIDTNGDPLLWMYYKDYVQKSYSELAQYINTILVEIRSKYYVCLNTGDIFSNVKDVLKFAGLGEKSLTSIQNCCNNKSLFSGKNKATGEKYVWRYYEEYVKMSPQEIKDAIRLGQIYTFEKAVVCLNTMERFASVNIASTKCDITGELIKNCCRGSHCVYLVPEHKYHQTVWAYEEDYKKMTESDIQERLNNAQYHKVNPSRLKKLVCLNDLLVFDTQKDAGKWANIKNPSNIGYSIKRNNGCAYVGKHPITNQKCCWMYLSDYIAQYGDEGLKRYQVA